MQKRRERTFKRYVETRDRCCSKEIFPCDMRAEQQPMDRIRINVIVVRGEKRPPLVSKNVERIFYFYRDAPKRSSPSVRRSAGRNQWAPEVPLTGPRNILQRPKYFTTCERKYHIAQPRRIVKINILCCSFALNLCETRLKIPPIAHKWNWRVKSK